MLIKTLTLITISVSILSPAAFAASVKPETVVGQFGFDWLKPSKAKCAAVTAEAAAKFKSCIYNGAGETGSFTGKADFTACKTGEKSEYMIYKTKARCEEELATMQANGE